MASAEEFYLAWRGHFEKLVRFARGCDDIDARSHDGVSCSFNVPYCTHAGNTLYSWRNKSCRAKTGAEACSPDKRARDRGHALAAAGISPGQWVLVEAFGDNDDEMWLGKTVGFSDFGRQSCYKMHTERQKCLRHAL